MRTRPTTLAIATSGYYRGNVNLGIYGIMRQMTEMDELRLIVPMAGWMDRHPKLTNVLIVVGIAALAWVVFTYEFTIPAYR